MYLLVAVISSVGYFSVVFADPEDTTYAVSDDNMLRNMVFELKSLVLDQREKIKALERRNEMQSEEIKEIRTMIEAQDAKILHLQRQRVCKPKVENKPILIEPTPTNATSRKDSTFKGSGIFKKGKQ